MEAFFFEKEMNSTEFETLVNKIKIDYEILQELK